MFIFFILLPLFYLASNIYIYCKLLRATKHKHIITRAVLSLLFWGTAFSLFISIGTKENEHLPDLLSRALFVAGSLWVVFIIFTAAISFIFDISRLILPKFKCNTLHAVFISALLLCYGYYIHSNPQIVPLDITLDKAMKDSLKIAVVSDLHLGHGTGKGLLKKYVEKINAEKPDLILITGDLIDNSLKPVIANHLDEELSLLNCPLGVYMAPGNHEHISGYEECDKFLKNTPIRLLRDTIITLPNNVQIIFRDDYINPSRADIFSLCAQTHKEKPTILLDHQPRDIALKDLLGIDIQLSGHTHHGQVWPGNYITDLLFEQSHGYRKWENSHVWVSSGVSLWGPPLRLGTRGDIAIITLKGQ